MGEYKLISVSKLRAYGLTAYADFLFAHGMLRRKEMQENHIAKIKRNPAAQAIAEQILKNYEIGSVTDMQDALKEIFGPMFENMLQGELDNHLGYANNSKEPKSTTNRRNGSTPKTLKTSMGPVEIQLS